MSEPKPLPLHKAFKFRDSMARYVYSKLFTWIVERCSESLRGEINHQGDKCLQVLDIFGFECVPTPELDPSSGKVPFEPHLNPI
jgi:myosin heavy subunit